MENLFDQSLLDFFASTPTQNIAMFLVFILIILLFLLRYKENKKEDTKAMSKFNDDLANEILKTMTEINDKMDFHIKDSDNNFRKYENVLMFVDKSNREIHAILNILLFNKIDDCEEFMAFKEMLNKSVNDDIKEDFKDDSNKGEDRDGK